MPIALFYGDDTYRLERAVKAYRDATVPPDFQALCYQRLNAPKLGEVVEALSTVRMALGGDSLLEIQDCPALGKAVKEGPEEAHQKRLLELLPNVEPSRHVLFVSTKVDKKLKLTKWLTSTKNGVQVQSFEVPPFWKAQEAEQNLLLACREEGVQVHPQAAALLVESNGHALYPLIMEVRKLALLAEGQPITAELVLQTSLQQENSFQLFEDWLLQARPSLQRQTLQQLRQSEAPTGIFLRFRAMLDTMLRLRMYRQQGVDYDVIAKQLGKKPYYLKTNDQKFRGVSNSRFWGLYTLSTDLETRLKQGRISDDTALELLLCS